MKETRLPRFDALAVEDRIWFKGGKMAAVREGSGKPLCITVDAMWREV